jgi:hypothetical protein
VGSGGGREEGGVGVGPERKVRLSRSILEMPSSC